MKAEYLIGSEVLPNNTVQDLVDFFMQMTPKTRRDSVVSLVIGDDIHDIRCVQCSQSDQAEKHELKVWIKAQKEEIK